MVSSINLDEVYTRCAEEFAQNMIDDTKNHTLECLSSRKAINRFLWQESRMSEHHECGVDR